jgi:DNA invertase Pin-like site-specific DNA recombinase
MAHHSRKKLPGNNSVALYLRVSTREQVEHGHSLEAQEATLRAYCTMRGLQVVEVVVDAGVSGGKPLDTRDGGRRILDLVARGHVSGVVAYKLDWLFRDCADCLTVTAAWDRAGVALHLVDLGGQTLDTSSAMGRFFLTVMAGAAELERNLIGERVTHGMQHLRAQHRRISRHTPYGSQVAPDGKHLEPVPAEQEVILAAKTYHQAGHTLRETAAYLEAHGHLSRTGKRFTPQAISNMVEEGSQSDPLPSQSQKEKVA